MNRRAMGPAWSVAMLAVLVTSGCFRLSRTSPPVERYVLGAAEAAARGTAAADTAGLIIGLRRLDLAPYLATVAIVVRRGEHEIVTSGFHRWAEEPTSGVNRAVATYLASSPTVRAVDVAPWPTRVQHDYVVQLHIARLEGAVPRDSPAGQGEAVIAAAWEITRPADGVLVARGVTDYRASGWTPGNYAGLVVLLDAGLATLARDVAACLSRVRSANPAYDADSACELYDRNETPARAGLPGP